MSFQKLTLNKETLRKIGVKTSIRTGADNSQGCGSQGCGSQGCGSQGCGSQGCGSQGCGSQGCGSQGCHRYMI